MATYVVSDLHGLYDIFINGLLKIKFTESDFLYVIGDAIDRGPDGIKILEYIKDHENMDLIIGNHEFMMLNSVDLSGKKKCNGDDTDLWLHYNGGNVTYENYKKLNEKSRKDLIAWLSERYVTRLLDINGEKICLAHSYFIKGCEDKKYNELEYSVVDTIVWNSVYRYGETHGFYIYDDYDYLFVTGHVAVQSAQLNMESIRKPKLMPYRWRQLIDIDGGCGIGYHPEVETGAIFLCLDDMKHYIVPISKAG